MRSQAGDSVRTPCGPRTSQLTASEHTHAADDCPVANYQWTIILEAALVLLAQLPGRQCCCLSVRCVLTHLPNLQRVLHLIARLPFKLSDCPWAAPGLCFIQIWAAATF